MKKYIKIIPFVIALFIFAIFELLYDSDPRIKKFESLVVTAYSTDGVDFREVDLGSLSDILGKLEAAKSIGYGGSKFEECGGRFFVVYDNEQMEMFTFYTRDGLDGCVLAESDQSHVYYNAIEILAYIESNKK